VPEAEALLVASDVHKIYRNGAETVALRGVNLTIRRRDFVALVGQSGSGKTTLLNLLGALDQATSGSISLDGRDYGRLSDDELAELRRQRIGFVFQFHYLLNEFTVLENALMPLIVGRGTPLREGRDYVLSLLDRVGMTPLLHKPATQLSGGQAQRVAVVRALVNKPSLILADEPTGNLDTDNGRQVFEIMRELNRDVGSAFVLVTHDDRLACQTDRLVRIQDGGIVQDVPTSELPNFECQAPAGQCPFQVMPESAKS